MMLLLIWAAALAAVLPRGCAAPLAWTAVPAAGRAPAARCDACLAGLGDSDPAFPFAVLFGGRVETGGDPLADLWTARLSTYVDGMGAPAVEGGVRMCVVRREGLGLVRFLSLFAVFFFFFFFFFNQKNFLKKKKKKKWKKKKKKKTNDRWEKKYK
jgi:preprotein translocase subunit SecG